jgi:hypothetical protein
VTWNIIGFAFIILAIVGPLLVVLFLGIRSDDDT